MTKSRRRSSAADDVDLATLGAALWRAKGWILGLTIGAGIVTFIALSMVRPLYTSEARVLIQNDESAFTRPTSDQGRDPQRTALDEQAVQSQVQVITSRDLILQVVKDLDLTDNAAFAKDAGVTLFRRLLNRFGIGRGTPRSEAEKAANALAEHLEVFPLSKSSVIAVDYTSGDPELAAQIANKLAEVYIAWQRTAKIEQTKDASVWLKDQIEVLRKRVAESEEAAETFRSSKGLYAGSNNITLNAQQLSELNSQLILADAQKSEAEARARLIKKMLADNGDIDATPEVLKSQLIINLIEQRVEVQRRLAELSATLLPSHPRIQQLKSELADVRAQIRAEADKVVKSLENEAHVAAAREASLRASLNAAKTQSAGLSDSEIKLRALEREAKSNRDLLESYLARYRDASARHDMGAVPAQATIVSQAHVSVLPSFPKRGPISLLVMAATALLSIAYVLARELIGTPQTMPQPAHAGPPRMRPRRPDVQPRPQEVPPAAASSPRPRPAAASAPSAQPYAPAAPAPAPAAVKPAARNLPVVIPTPASAPTQAQQSAASSDASRPSAPTTPWHVKEHPPRPSWLRANVRRRAVDTAPKAPASTPQAETPVATSEALGPEASKRTAPEPQVPKPEALEPEALEPEALEPEAPAVEAPESKAPPKPAATGLLDRLRQEFSSSEAPSAPSVNAPKREPRSAKGLLDRFRLSRSGKKDGQSPASTAKPAPTGVEMSSLSPNDLRHYLTQRIAAASSDVDDEIPPAPKIGNGPVGPVLKSLAAVFSHVLASTKGGLPRALLVAGVSPKADATQAAIGLARSLVDKEERVVLVDLTRGASAVSGPLGMPRAPGFTDLAAGRAGFAEVIRVDNDTPLQVITAGNPAVRGEGHEPDRFMRVFEALTQAYDCVVLHADLGTVRTLMPALKFELPVMVAVLPEGSSADRDGDALSAFQALGCPILVYEHNGKRRGTGWFSRTAAM